MVLWLFSQLEIASLVDISVRPSNESEYLLTNWQTDLSRKINDSDLLSSIKEKKSASNFVEFNVKALNPPAASSF